MAILSNVELILTLSLFVGADTSSERPSRRPQGERFADFLYLRASSPCIHTACASSNANIDRSKKKLLLVVRVRAPHRACKLLCCSCNIHAHRPTASLQTIPVRVHYRITRALCAQEVPNVFLENPAQFHSLISEFVRAFQCNASLKSSRSPAPVVFIFSLDAGMTAESGGSSATWHTSSANGFRRVPAYLSPLERLFPRALRDQLHIPLLSSAFISFFCFA